MFVFVFYALLCVHPSFAIILKRKRKLVALLVLSYRCIVAINILWLFLKVLWVGLQCVIVAFPDHAHLLFVIIVSLACQCCPAFSGICLHQEKKQRCQSGDVELYPL